MKNSTVGPLSFLKKNLSWSFHKNCFSHLLVSATTEEQLVHQLYRLADRYFPQQSRISLCNTEFCLNEIALQRATCEQEKFVKQLFNGYWQDFLRVKNTLSKQPFLFPSDGKQTRLEKIAQLFVQCTQCAISQQTRERLCHKITEIFDLTEMEKSHLKTVLRLLEIDHYCAVAKNVFEKGDQSEKSARLLESKPLNTEFCQNLHLRHAYYSSGQLVANVDCFCNSATKFTVPTRTDVKASFFVNGKNVFDTFCYSKFGQNTAEFFSESATLRVSAQYFLYRNTEVRKYTVENLGKGKKKLIADFSLKHLDADDKTSYFSAEGALCQSVSSKEDFYCALAIVHDNKIVPCPFEEGRLSACFEIPQNASVQFDTVTIFAENMPALADALQEINRFGQTRCPFVCDSPSTNLVTFDYPLHPTSHGHTKRQPPQREADTLSFTYQLGNENVASFLDNAGNVTTLLNGFAFGVGGEKVFAVKNGAMSQINCGKFALDGQKIVYRKPNGTTCTLSHDGNKTYAVRYPTPLKTLFYFPLEEKCQISYQNNTFFVSGSLRKFSVKLCGKMESFTTNALECNTERLRYKLSNNISCGSCLAVCFATAAEVSLEIASAEENFAPAPLIKESLISTYLNYLNSKSVFCINNCLKRTDSLTLAAICFTNPQFVKHYVTHRQNKFFYDASGRQKPFWDKLALPLAIVYHALLTGETELVSEWKNHIEGVLFNETFVGYDLCTKALLAKRASHLSCFDKVRCLIEYNTLKRAVTSDKKLYAYAQAIGAVPLVNPGKQRLKDLFNRYQLPKSWYYVSQLENLYGMTLVDGALHFAPKVTQENVLEEFALTLFGKRIDTTFQKSAVQSMTLNGTQYFLPVQTKSLKNTNNTLVVRY